MPAVSMAGRAIVAVALAVTLAAAVAMGITHWLDSPVLGVAAGMGLGAPVLLWLAMWIIRPWGRTVQAVANAIESLRDRDFSVSIASPGPRELRGLVEAYNTLGELLRRERFDIYQRELLLDTVLQTTPLCLTLTNDTGRIVYGNIAARELLRGGRKLEGLELKSLLTTQPAALREALAAEGDTLFTMEVAGQNEVYHLSRRTFLLHTQPHQLMLLKQLTRELSAQEVAVWKKVIRVIAHELSNSVAPISSLVHSGLLLAATSDPTDGAQLERIFSTIGERTAHLATFIEGYARFAKLPKPRPAPISWPQFLARLSDTLTFTIEPPVPRREACLDAGQLEQAMTNLLKNAAESGSPPEAITVRVRELVQGFLIEVADRGTGFGEQALRDALLPFFSTKATGTGLGLTLCREIVEAHGGRLRLANRPGGGAVISIRLPWPPCPDAAHMPH